MRLIAIGLIVVIGIFSALEIGRWSRPDLSDMLTATQKGRRIAGLLIFFVLGLMMLGGTYWPDPKSVPTVIQDFEALYWLFFALLTVFIPLIAFFEFKDSLHRANELRREAYRNIVTAPLDKLTEDNDSGKKSRS